MLLSGISTAGGFEPDAARWRIQPPGTTCEGTAKGAPCAFPFYNDVSDTQLEVEFFEPTYAGEAVALGVTLRNLDYGDIRLWELPPIRTEWLVGNWSNCRFLVAVAFEHDLSNVSRSRRVNRSMHRCVVSGPQAREATRDSV